jgi:hypothetical protein
MGWRTLQQMKAKALIQELTLPKLLTAVSKNDPKPIAALRTPDGRPVFSQAEAETLVERLSESNLRWELETCAVHDLPRLRVTKAIKDAEGNTAYATREFKKLSLGQQQSVLLALMLTSGSSDPLI